MTCNIVFNSELFDRTEVNSYIKQQPLLINLAENYDDLYNCFTVITNVTNQTVCSKQLLIHDT